MITMGIGILILLLLLGVLPVRAWRFCPPKKQTAAQNEITVDAARAVEHLQAMLRCKTISEPEMREEAEFEKFRDLLPEFYPRLWAAAEVERVDATGVLIRLKGNAEEHPAVFLGHYDVVPVQAECWEKPPFAGVLEEGVLWGRGALDMKNQLCGMLEAAETLLERGFIPRRDIYFALSGEEEVMGPSARSMRDLLKTRGIAPDFVLDEGGDIMDELFPGTKTPCAMVGIGEKGVANLSFIARSKGGHASVPVKDNPLSRLCRAMERVEKRPFPIRPGKALEALVDTMGRYCKFSTRLLLANRDILRPLYFRWLKRQGGMIEASARTTFALTRARGAQAGNVIPSEASMSANLRLMAGDTVESVTARLRRRIRDVQIEIVPGSCTEPVPDSMMTAGFDEIRSAIEATWPQAVVTPYLMVACTDSRHWREICDNVYRFSAKYITSEEKATVHGDNERIRIENTENAVKFFIRLLRRC